jgi:uncharacterized membrane protein
MSYAAFKIVHVFGVVLFLGNIIVTAMWKALADQTKDPRIVAFAQRLITRTDWVFTLGGIVMLVIGAYGMVFVGGLDLRQGWLMWGQGLFAASGVVWVAVLLPVQTAQSGLARGFAAGGEIPKRYWELNRRWMIWGTIATVLPLANLYVMIIKP